MKGSLNDIFYGHEKENKECTRVLIVELKEVQRYKSINNNSW